MKKIFSTMLVALACHAVSAQNTFPTPSGNVGIGTTNPLTPLSVVGVTTISVNNATGDASNLLLYNSSAISTTNDARGDIWLDNDGHLKIRSVSGYGTAFRNTSNTADILTINDNGLFIGTSTMPSGYSFAVNGSVLATSITVKAYANWPDYVFKPTYHLPSLSEVKTYVDLNHHLPEIPSEKEIATNGLNLGDIDRLLTKKVEELTLYLIEKDKQLSEEKIIIDKQEKDNYTQKQINQQISNQLDSQQKQLKQLKELLLHRRKISSNKRTR